MNELTITVDDMQVPLFKSKVMTLNPLTEDGLRRPLVIESFEDEFKVCDVMCSPDGVILFSIEALTELDDVVDGCVTIGEVQNLTQYWQDFTADNEVTYIHLVNKIAFDAITQVVRNVVTKTIYYN